MLAEDGGSPPQSSTATVQIDVERNLNAPIFNPVRNEVTILETLGLGESVTKVTATDKDLIVGLNFLYNTDLF